MALVKLSFTTYDSPACDGSIVKGPIYVFFNPTDYTRSYKNLYIEDEKLDASKAQKFFKGAASEVFNLDNLMVDSSVVSKLSSNSTQSVGTYVDALKVAIYDYVGTEHGPSFVLVSWGDMLFKGLCNEFTVQYTHFDSTGIALRAKIKLAFESSLTSTIANKMAGKSSPDLTHSRTVKAGDNLSMMSRNIYKDSSYYLELARTNNLNSVFDIKPGDQIFFPPIKK